MTHRVRVLTATLLIAVPVLFLLFYGLLTMTFDYPGILREPAGEILRRFAVGGPSLVLLWYGFALTPALFIPASILLRRAFPATTAVLDLAIPLGVLAGLTQVLGLIRWPFLVPELARTFLDPAASEATQAAALTVFGAFHQYAGVAIGEHLGYLFTGAWTLVIAGAMVTAPVFRPWLGWAGIVSALGILVGLLEPAGITLAGTINAIAYLAWSLWLVATGISLLRAHPQVADNPVAVDPTPAHVPFATHP
ncbi:MAG: hypothetical protein K0R44_3042 [Thermomicrobiales bacterium]|jgi:hypothetical protein|nr:hypothetical protein [Thermomicrobiales bacterium]